MSDLHTLAREAGLEIDWRDAAGRQNRVTDDSLIAVLEALGLPARTASQRRESRERLRREQHASSNRFQTAECGEAIILPDWIQGAARLTLEGGGVLDIAADCETIAIETPGYHLLEATGGELTIAVAPRSAWTVADAAPDRRIWGTAVQIPSLRDARGEAFGDFGALARFVRSAASHGADAVAMSPVHALFPSDPGRFSPYGPSSRLFLNVWLADPSLLGDVRSAPSGETLIDWNSAVPERMARLRHLYEQHAPRLKEEMAAFQEDGGERLERHACYDSLYAHFLAQDGARDWQDWPAEYQDPAGPAVAAYARNHAGEIEFYVFLQWLADLSLAAASRAAQDGGMAIGLIADLAVGISPGGSEAWSSREHLLSGLSIGAPPDPLGPQGQDWGITSFSPRGLIRSGYEDFIATTRTAIRHAGGIRIDHAMSLRRLWLVPHGAGAREGVYLAYPEQDLMRLLALESWRARAIVIGEDLGTVPPGFRETLNERGISGMRVLWFERTAKGGFRSPRRWGRNAAAMTSTHDLATVAGWWTGRDIDWTRKLGRSSASEAKLRADRAVERRLLWAACRRAGSARTAAPVTDDPAPAVDAAVSLVGTSACDLAIVPVEDLSGEIEQPNLPGTIEEHPNWRRRLAKPAESIFEDLTGRLRGLEEARRS